MQLMLVVLGVLVLAGEVRAAVVLGSVVSAEANVGTPNTLSQALTIDGDADAALVGVCERDTNASGFTVDTATVTIAGASATQLLGHDNGVSIRALLFYQLTPATGTPTIAVTGDTGNDRLVIGVMSLKGVQQSSTFNTAGTGSGLGVTNADIDALASAAGEFAVMLGCIRTNAITPSADATAPVSAEQLDVAHTDSTSVRAFLYTEAGASPTLDMRVDLSGSGDWAGVAVSIRAATGGAFGPLRRRY